MSSSVDSLPRPPPPDKFTVADAAVRERVAADTPIRFDARTDEPYLQLAAPLDRFRLTPARFSDAEEVSRVLSTLSVARNILGPTFPFTAKQAGGWLRMLRGTATSVFAALEQGTYHGLPGHPFCFLREVDEDGGQDAFVGEISMGVDERAQRITPVGEEWEVWRDKGVWTIGACLSEEFHGRGLAKAAVDTLLNSFGVPFAGATEIHAFCFARNAPSVRLWLGAGFIKDDARSGKMIKIDEAKGGGEVEEACYVWTLK